jgi:large subunit ribosomal protein L7/L12
MTDDKQILAASSGKKEKKKVSNNVEKLVEEISKLTVLELSDLTNALQEKLGISAMPMAVSNPAPAATAADAAPAAGDESGGGAQNLIMTASGENKIAVIKALREINQNWGLKEAKDMTEQLPAELIKGGKPEDVKSAAEKLKAAGATTEMK